MSEHNYFGAAQPDTTITVNNDAELKSALKTLAKTGGTIEMSSDGGSYGVNLRNIGSASKPITLTSQNPDDPATINWLTMRNVSHVAVTDVIFDSSSTIATRAKHWQDINVTGSDNIAFIDNVMIGNATGFYDPKVNQKAISASIIQNSDTVDFIGNKISNYYSGASFNDVKNLNFSNNDISKLQGDGFRGGGFDNATISDNTFHDFLGTYNWINHADMIQIWGVRNAQLTKNVEVSGNVLDSGDGPATQGIFIRNEDFGKGGKTGGHFENIQIFDNTVYNGLTNAIALSDAKDSAIYNNTVLWNQEAKTYNSRNEVPKTAEPRLSVRNTPDTEIYDNIGRQNILDGSATVRENLRPSYTNDTWQSYVENLFDGFDLSEIVDLSQVRVASGDNIAGLFGSAFFRDEVENATPATPEPETPEPETAEPETPEPETPETETEEPVAEEPETTGGASAGGTSGDDQPSDSETDSDPDPAPEFEPDSFVMREDTDTPEDTDPVDDTPDVVIPEEVAETPEPQVADPAPSDQDADDLDNVVVTTSPGIWLFEI